jgi:hypothetical protein
MNFTFLDWCFAVWFVALSAISLGIVVKMMGEARRHPALTAGTANREGRR